MCIRDRVLVINGQVAQRIARVGRGTITNLHIDASRLDAEQALQSFGAKTIAAVYDVCRRAAACFPGQLAVGVDVMVAVSYTHLDVYKRQARASSVTARCCSVFGSAPY